MKNILIVGSSSGLGFELSKLLKENNLFLLSRNIMETSLSGRNIKKIVCDLQSIKSIKIAIGSISKPIDIFINCAGIELENTLDKCTDQQIKDILETNLIGAIYISKYVYKKMLKNKNGFIINVSSTSGKKARNKEAVYCASKFGLAGFTESLRLEAKKNNIKVCTVFPGGMITNFWKNNPKDISKYMNPKHVAQQIIYLINSNYKICPSELVIERI